MKKKLLVALFAVMSVASASAYIIKVETPLPSYYSSPLPSVKITTLPFRIVINLSDGYRQRTIPAHLIAAQLELELVSGPNKGAKTTVRIPPKLVGKDIVVFIDTHRTPLAPRISKFRPRR